MEKQTLVVPVVFAEDNLECRHVLTIRDTKTGKLRFPGGIVPRGVNPEHFVVRWMKENMGFTVEIIAESGRIDLTTQEGMKIDGRFYFLRVRDTKPEPQHFAPNFVPEELFADPSLPLVDMPTVDYPGGVIREMIERHLERIEEISCCIVMPGEDTPIPVSMLKTAFKLEPGSQN